jgi:hypothetical protein
MHTTTTTTPRAVKMYNVKHIQHYKECTEQHNIRDPNHNIHK